ncbi:glycerol dehydrogenase [Caviibacter abscessus]|uniref:glycerol dehydrogenase n=1 Tax=Caviibacter abscessus TaxID=1766719 RepID=UPI00083326E5|nr:glycerol dehydrogenase [Caviibacter abscessus]
MSRIIFSPSKYIQGKDEIKKISSHYKNLGTKGAYILVDKFIFDNYKENITYSFVNENVPYHLEIFGGECSKKEVNKHIEIIKEKGLDAVIAIGGGKTIDAGKAISHYLSLPVIVVPTAASTDAPCSALSVLYTENGEFEEYLFLKANPNAVIMDTNILVNAPSRLLIAGIGDALATYFEAQATTDSHSNTIAGGKASKTSLALAKLCLNILMEDGLKAKISCEQKAITTAFENVVEANTYLSGVGFESGGLAAAHAVHNGLTILKEGHDKYHGEKVAFGTLVQFVLENRDMKEIKEIIKFCKSVGLPTCLKDLNMENVSKEELYKVAVAATAPNETIHNMPFEVTADSVFAAILTADKLGSMEL